MNEWTAPWRTSEGFFRKQDYRELVVGRCLRTFALSAGITQSLKMSTLAYMGVRKGARRGFGPPGFSNDIFLMNFLAKKAVILASCTGKIKFHHFCLPSLEKLLPTPLLA